MTALSADAVAVELGRLVDAAETAEAHARTVWVARDVERLGTLPLRDVARLADRTKVPAALAEIEELLSAWVADYAGSGLTAPGSDLRDRVREVRTYLDRQTIEAAS